MISEFKQLAEKVDQLAALTHAMRREAADLRRQVVTLTETNTQLTARMQTAHERVSALLEQMPMAEQESME